MQTSLRTRPRRLLAILVASCVYFFLLVDDGFHSFSSPSGSTLLVDIIHFGFAGLVSLLFLAVGSLVLLYARDRLAGLLLFCFSCAMAYTFAVQTVAAADVGNASPLSAISHISATLSLPLFSSLLLVFPHSFLAPQGRGSTSRLLPRLYLVVLVSLGILVVSYEVLKFFSPGLFPERFDTFRSAYSLLALCGILCTIVASYRHAPSLRVRQQRRLFVAAVILAFAPLLVLSILPLTLGLSAQYVVDSQLSAITLGLFPLFLGYSLLRYQILIFDRYIQRAVAWIMGVILLLLLAYIVTAGGSLFLASDTAAYIGFVSISLLILGPITWWLAKLASERIFFQEISYYRRLINQPNLLMREALTLDGAASVITTAVATAFETQEACLFVLHETGSYHPYPSLDNDTPQDSIRRDFIQRLLNALAGDRQPPKEPIADIIEHLSASKRPLLLSEATTAVEDRPTGLARYMRPSGSSRGFDALLAPVRVQGKVIGVLVCGERGDAQPYAGPDFEAAQLIVDRYGSMLEIARLYEAASQQQARINAELREAYERQKELDRLKDQFITTASHELRTPLTAVVGYIELLSTYNDSLSLEKRAEFIAKAHRGCDELTLVVGNIMEAGRVQDDIDNLNLIPVSLAQSVTHILEILEAMTQNQHRHILMAIPTNLYVMADDLHLRQVLLNLISNAMKYSPERTDIDVTCDADAENITVRIHDRGLGVPPQDQQRLFQRFVRLERDMNSPTRGAGLGLHISKQLVEAMGGRIWVESTGIVGEGSTFAFMLKRAVITQQNNPLFLITR